MQLLAMAIPQGGLEATIATTPDAGPTAVPEPTDGTPEIKAEVGPGTQAEGAIDAAPPAGRELNDPHGPGAPEPGPEVALGDNVNPEIQAEVLGEEVVEDTPEYRQLVDQFLYWQSRLAQKHQPLAAAHLDLFIRRSGRLDLWTGLQVPGGIERVRASVRSITHALLLLHEPDYDTEDQSHPETWNTRPLPPIAYEELQGARGTVGRPTVGSIIARLNGYIDDKEMLPQS